MRLPAHAASITCAFGIFFSSMSSAPAYAQSNIPETPCSTRYSLAWEIPFRNTDVGTPIGTVLSRSEFSLARTEHTFSRMSVGAAPDGTVGLQMNIPRGQNAPNGFYLDPLGSKGVDAACLSLRLFLPNGFEWPKQGGGTKMAWGLWGGEPRRLGGGTYPANQLGWSVRNVNSIWGFGLYSYNLNRPGKHGQYGPRVDRWGTSNWGTGRWHEIEMEVVLNDPGRSNGYAQVWLNGQSRRTMTNLIFRHNNEWAIRGLMAQDMWGGNTADPINFSPKNQRMWYANYKLYTRHSSNNLQISEPSAATPTSSGSFGPTAPSGSVGGRSVTLTWTPDADADRYYVRVLTNRARFQDRRSVHGSTVQRSSCSQSQCTLTIGNLPRDEYEWMVRPHYGSREGNYKAMMFNVIDASKEMVEFQNSSSPQSSPKKFSAVSPKGTVDGRSVTLTWTPDADADRYFVRVLTNRARWQDRRSVHGSTVQRSSCNESQCTLTIGNLPRDEYEWMVRPHYGPREGSYSSLPFSVR